MNKKVMVLFVGCLLMNVANSNAMAIRQVKPQISTFERLRDGSLLAGAAYLGRSHLSFTHGRNAAAAIVLANALMPNFVRRKLHQVPVVKELVYSPEERLWLSGVEIPVSYNRQLLDMTALGTLAAVFHAKVDWTTIRSLAVIELFLQAFSPDQLRRVLADVPLLRKIVGSHELDYDKGILHQVWGVARGFKSNVTNAVMKLRNAVHGVAKTS